MEPLRPRRRATGAREWAPALALALSLSACVDALAPGDRASPMFLDSCSLACTRGDEGVAVFCSTVNTHQNRDITLRFSQPIDPASVDREAFRIVEASTGVAPAGQLAISPLDDRSLVFRPALTFDEVGAPSFGLREGVAYRLSLAGELQGDPGPYVRSRAGAANRTRMDCTIVADQGVLDLVPGPPSVEVFAEVVTAWDGDGNPLAIEAGRRLTRDPADLSDVHRASPLRFVFRDLMNPATLARNTSGEAPFVRVEIDADGRLETGDDRAAVAGRFEVRVDVDALVTELFFHPDPGYPTAGDRSDGDGLPRCVVVTVPDAVTDLVGHPLPVENGGGQLAFVPERFELAELRVPGPDGVRFQRRPGEALSYADPWRTGADWGDGRLRPGTGGGSGRLGELVVRSGETIVLDTDRQTFPIAGRAGDVLGGRGAGVGPSAGTLVVEGGRFELAALRVEADGRLVLRGSRPARVQVSGPIVVHHGGRIDLAGGTPPPHDSSTTHPELGIDVRRIGGAFEPVDVATVPGEAGPGGGRGGFGGDRHDFGPGSPMLALHDANSDARDLAGVVADPRGRAGEGVGGRGSGGGAGGARAPVTYPATGSTLEAESGSSVGFDVVSRSGDDVCFARQLGGSGGGGAHATDGAPGSAVPHAPLTDYPVGGSNVGPASAGGRAPLWELGAPGADTPARRLAGRDDRLLRGGGGGGGGGSHCYATRASGLDGDATHACIGTASSFVEWHDHSGAPGGGGGGACKLTSGASAQIHGVVDARGGDGGRAGGGAHGGFGLPGGGGAGGGVRLRAPRVELGSSPGRIDVSGGEGGSFLPGEPGVRGGAGGVGLVRIEDSVGQLERLALARAVLPYEPADDSLGWLSLGPGAWVGDPAPPGCRSAATSCWMRPEGLFYALDFLEDRGGGPEEQGWNMELEWRVGGELVRVPYRGENPWYPRPLDEVLGNDVGDARGGGSPVAVRFQGARATGPGTRFCGRPLDGAGRAVLEGSVTPWVAHPAELDVFRPRPDMIRFTVVFDPSAPGFRDGPWPEPAAGRPGAGREERALEAVTGLWIAAHPD